MTSKKTNAMRMLDSAEITYDIGEYAVDENDLSGLHIASSLGIDPDIMFKTLVAKGDRLGYLVFCIPCKYELDMKKAAIAAGDKRVEMIQMKELLPLTGYIRGGCSPIGMKKQFPTFIDESATLFDKIYVSAGERGKQLIISPDTLAEFIHAQYADLLK